MLTYVLLKTWIKTFQGLLLNELTEKLRYYFLKELNWEIGMHISLTWLGCVIWRVCLWKTKQCLYIYIKNIWITIESQGIHVGQKYQGIIKLDTVRVPQNCFLKSQFKAALHDPWQKQFTYYKSTVLPRTYYKLVNYTIHNKSSKNGKCLGKTEA